MRSFLTLFLATVASAQDCDDFHAIKCTHAFIAAGCDFANGAPTGLGWSCQPYADCSIKACDDEEKYNPFSSIPFPPSWSEWIADPKVKALGSSDIVKTSSTMCSMYVVGENIAVDTKLSATMTGFIANVVKSEKTATVDAAFTKATTFIVDVKGPGVTMHAGPEAVASKKFLKDLTKIACPKVDPDAPGMNPDQKACTASFTESKKVNEFGAWTFTVQVVQPIDPAVEVVDMENVVKNGLEARTGVSKLGYDFPIKKVTMVKIEVAADICVSLTEITPAGQKSKAPTKVLAMLQKSPAGDMAKAIAVSPKVVSSYVDASPEISMTTISCPSGCFSGVAWEVKPDKITGKGGKPGMKSLLFGKHPFCPPECRMVSGYKLPDLAPAKKNMKFDY